ncbi:hypothetical protein Ccrd_022362 [Cynara cardunculus var. scolymus]|uniref:Leucine-rich repeat-containing protein n=1 Tax=Cynara cardunculus var. scolymus TaxID=59895 RepID=A0A103XYS7_CYNCS|nr:hypothetical protein Ccrd_022362 [Cynara cardunculus var. scolymus]
MKSFDQGFDIQSLARNRFDTMIKLMAQELHLANNQLIGIIPPGLGKTTASPQLTELHLANNQLIGIIPPRLGKTTALVGLWLFMNSLMKI